MSNKTYSARITHKHDIEENWNKAINFIPLVGEIIIYDKDDTNVFERIKVGDGYTNVVDLPFIVDVTNSLVYRQNEEPIDAPENSLWVDLDAESAGSSGGTGSTNVTPESIGAAPAGYGLGEDMGVYAVSTDDLDNIKYNCWFCLNSMSGPTYPITICNISFIFAYGIVCKYNTNVRQELYVYGNNFRISRIFNGSTWSEWEIENPPMVPGVEYRTTEKWNNKAVYCKLVDCGEPSNGKEVAHGCNSTKIIRYYSNRNVGLPLTNGSYSDSNALWVDCDLTNITIYAGSSVSGNTVYVTMYYTKD